MPYADPKLNREYHRQYYLKNREKIIQQTKEWRESHPERQAELLRNWRKANPQRMKELSAKWAAANPEKVRESKRKAAEVQRQKHPQKTLARVHVGHAVRAGRLKRAPVCRICGVVCKTQGHHHNGYSKEVELDVVWLCAKCHRSLHVF